MTHLAYDNLATVKSENVSKLSKVNENNNIHHFYRIYGKLIPVDKLPKQKIYVNFTSLIKSKEMFHDELIIG